MVDSLGSFVLFRMGPSDRQHRTLRPTAASRAIAVAFAAAYLLAPPIGRDFSAQLAHAELAESH